MKPWGASLLIVTPQVSADGTEASITFDCGTFAPITWKILPQTRLRTRFRGDASANFALLAAVPFALSTGAPLHVNGDVCPELLGHVENLIRFRAMLNPSKASRIELSCNSTRSRTSLGERTEKPYVMALSGSEKWVRFSRQFGGLAKVDLGFGYAANFSSSACIA